MTGKTAAAPLGQETSPLPTGQPTVDPLIINEVQLILAEKRTALAVMRTGIAILVLPLSIVSFLVATSRYYNPSELLHYLIPVAIINLVLIVLGGYLLVYSLRRILHHDRLIRAIKQKHSAIADYID